MVLHIFMIQLYYNNNYCYTYCLITIIMLLLLSDDMYTVHD